MPTFAFPTDDDDSLPPSTPDRIRRHGSGKFAFDDDPTTTPAGPPPSEAASFTPAGAPSDSYLGSSMMRGVTTQKRQAAPQSNKAGNFSRNLFGSLDSSPQQPIGHSITSTTRGSRGPSALSREYDFGDSTRQNRGRTYHIPSDDEDEDDDDDEEVDEVAEADEEMKRYIEADIEEPEDESGDDGGDEDLFLNMRHRPADEYDEEEDAEGDDEQDAEGEYEDDGEGDLVIDDASEDREPMEIATPAATARMRKEAESIFRASSYRRSSTSRAKDFRYSSMAKNLYTDMGFATITEPAEVILRTEGFVNRLYDEGIGAKEDSEHLDISLANIAQPLAEQWGNFAAQLPMPHGEDRAEVGPSQRDEPFRKAAYVANLALRLHHARMTDKDSVRAQPLPGVLFSWARESNDLYQSQLHDVATHMPSPACHSLYWQTLSGALLRGDVAHAIRLLKTGGWESVRKGPRGGFAYQDKVLGNVRRAVAITCDMLEMCPGKDDIDDDKLGDWDIFNSDWTLFRIQAQGSFDKLQRFAEGKDRSTLVGSDAGDTPSRTSLARMARKAESSVPWDIYEHLQGIYEIALGVPDTILEISQDWCEATVGLFGWWETGRSKDRSLRMSRSHLALPGTSPGADVYFDRLQTTFHTIVDSDFHFNAMNPVEVAVASAFEGNFSAVIGFLRAWSLPVASAVAELASLGQWLPKPEAPNLITLESLDMEDLDILGVAPQGKDETEGIKDTTLVHYARELAGIDQLSADKDGWELAVQVLGRMDSAGRSEEMVGELLRDILDSLDAESGHTVDKAWHMLNDLGMIQYAEETAETYAEILANNSHRYGEALWYYALAHRPSKVREVLNLLMSYSLIQSTVFPAIDDLDDHLHRLLTERTETLERYAKQDLEAAQLLGRILSGYATLRKFYEMRDTEGLATMPSHKAMEVRRQAVSSLVAVIASSDDNIRGGLFDDTRDAVVSEDFVLVLLGEALSFINNGDGNVVVTLDQMDVLLKAIEDIETVSTRIYGAADEFFNLVLASAQGLKGSSPMDLMRKSTSGLSGASSYVMSSSSMLASQLHRSVSAGTAGGVGGSSGPGSDSGSGNIKRGWDWRSGLLSSATSRDVLRLLRLGLSKDLARLWLAEADDEPVF